jgi:hypothetical protein
MRFAERRTNYLVGRHQQTGLVVALAQDSAIEPASRQRKDFLSREI